MKKSEAATEPAISGLDGRQRSMPQYAVVAATLISEIRTGKYPVGSLLPTEHQLSDEFQRSRQTIREALRHLSTLGLVTRQPGVGTRVVQRTPLAHYAYSINSMTELEDYADGTRLLITSIDPLTVRGDLARQLGCSDGAAWLHLKGTRFAKSDGLPIGTSEIYLRAWYPGVEEHLRALTGAIHVMLSREYGAMVEEIRQDARAVLLDAGTAEAVGSTPGSAGMEVVRRYYVHGERLVLMGRIIYAAERFSFSMRLRRTKQG